MYIIKYLLAMVLVLGQHLLQAEKAFVKTKLTTLSGSINLDSNYMMVINDLFSAGTDSQEEITLSQNGTFKWESKLDKPIWYQISFLPKQKNQQLGASFPVFVKPGDKLNFNLLYSKDTYLQLVDDRKGHYNDVLIAYSGFTNRKIKDLFIHQKTGDAFLNSIQEYIDEADALAINYKIKQKEVLEYLKLWSYNNYLTSFYGSRNLTLPTHIAIEIPKLFNSPFIAGFYNGTGNINNYVNSLIPLEKDAIKRMEKKVDKLKELFSSPWITEKVINSDLQHFVSSYRIIEPNLFQEDTKRLASLIQTIGNDELRASILTDFKNLHYTSTGSLIPDIKFKDINGNQISLDKFKGKYIYIDLWASWCIPCIKEIPFLHEIENKYKDNDIVFVSISLDEDKTAWKNKIKELGLEGHQWELGDSRYDKLMNVRGIPHFILYGKDGRLMMYNAPRPSSDQVKRLFEHLDW